MRARVILTTAMMAAMAVGLTAQHGATNLADILPMEHPAIEYSSSDPTDAVARLQARIDAGETELAYDRRFGYLPAVLDALGIPLSSQALVFSKTSFQAVRIFPRGPRAIYHAPEVSVGWVRGGDVVEIASLDPKLGVVFYTLDQRESSHPRFRLRVTECISCHVGPATMGVPGLMVRSVYADRNGRPMRGPSYLTDHRSPLSERWGGWYLSGLSGSQTHLGNLVVEGSRIPREIDFRETNNLEKLRGFFDAAAYLQPTSDIVSLMVLEHETGMVNRLVRLGYESRILLDAAGSYAALPEQAMEKIERAADELVRYTLFAEEALLEEPVKGTDAYQQAFEAGGVRDDDGRSLRDLDLETRLLRYPCSYLVYSEAFDALPEPVLALVYEGMWDALNGDGFGRLSADDRKAIIEILRATKSGLPDYWMERAAD